MEQGQLELGGECVAAVSEKGGSGPRLELLRHTVTAQLSLLRSTAGLPQYSRAAVEVSRGVTAVWFEGCCCWCTGS